MKLIPGTPFNSWEKLSETQRHILLVKYGFDQPVPVQYVHYIMNMVKGDLGVSFQFNNTPVTELIAQRIGPSTILNTQTIIINTILKILLNIITTLKQNT